MMHASETDTVADLVATDFRAAAVFERAGIDFCCGGRRSLADACRAAGVPLAGVIRDLDALPPQAPSEQDDPRQWPIPRLVEYIVMRHHAYVRRALPLIGSYLPRLIDAHGARHPELTRVDEAFQRVRADLLQHMLKEEQVLFPYIRELAATESTGRPLPPSPFGTVENPIRMMEREHQAAGDEMATLRGLTGGYVTPKDGCATYQAAMGELNLFEHDLHEHVHLENNVLFPRAVALERQLRGRTEAAWSL